MLKYEDYIEMIRNGQEPDWKELAQQYIDYDNEYKAISKKFKSKKTIENHQDKLFNQNKDFAFMQIMRDYNFGYYLDCYVDEIYTKEPIFKSKMFKLVKAVKILSI